MNLNPAQLAFLGAVGHGIPVHRMEWLNACGQVIRRATEPRATLRAHKRVGAGLRCFLISEADLAGLGPYWDQPLTQVNAEGMALLAAALNPVES